MNTPICDFVRDYIANKTIRMHMPGHKGNVYPDDITEIKGADVLYHSDGIIRESENNAASIFGSLRTIYSCEGSSLCIRAMLQLAHLYAMNHSQPFRILAGRNAHKAFMYAASVIDPEVEWIYGHDEEGLLSCTCDPEELDERLDREYFTCVYITSPDYTGHMNDIRSISEVCHRHGTLLIVDNAHGAYLRFVENSCHPMDSGADMCCDSAHKTLPVLTGGAYLHIGKNAPPELAEWAEDACAMFASTSPSYVIMQSLDRANAVLTSPEWINTFHETLHLTNRLREKLTTYGYVAEGNEPMKLTLLTRSIGYSGTDIAERLHSANIECEYSDPDRIVLMPAPDTNRADYEFIERILTELPIRKSQTAAPPAPPESIRRNSIREAMLGPRERIDTKFALGRVLADACVSCPPAVPILVPGEVITEKAVQCFEYYGINSLTVMK